MKQHDAFQTEWLVFPKERKDEIDQAAIEWLNEELENRQDQIFDEHGQDRMSDCWPEIMDAYLDTIAWMWTVSQHVKGTTLQKELKALVRELAKQVYYMRNAETGGIPP